MASTNPPSPPQTVDITNLTPTQLHGLKKQLDDELEHLTTSFARLRTAQAKFRECIKSIQETFGSAGAQGKDILIPLTTSLYVPGKMASSASASASASTSGGGTGKQKEETGKDKVIVDVGTGFFVEKNLTDATEFYTAKIEELTANLKTLEGIVQTKSGNLRTVEEVLRQKVMSGAATAAIAGAGDG
ncbi:MAG: subunit of tubulin prefoldin [Peltula sp. TS41687]|nr:MAG: subunit of tubulin prefoldin [Peltula sp. TS41687]